MQHFSLIERCNIRWDIFLTCRNMLHFRFPVNVPSFFLGSSSFLPSRLLHFSVQDLKWQKANIIMNKTCPYTTSS